MDKLLPTIEIQKPDSSANTPVDEPAVKQEKLPEQQGNMDLIDDIMEQSEDKEDIINIEEREIPEEDEVFLADSKERKPQKISPVNNITDEPTTPEEFPQKKTKRKYVRKAPMSDKQRNHLARMREIASEKRRLERERKAKEKEEALVAKAEKKILEKKKKEEDESLKKQRAEQEKINYQPKPEKVNGFTKEDLDNAVLSAISQYDTLRKQQKKEKREAEKKRAEEEKMKATLARAINPTPTTPNDPWRGFFT